MSPPRKPADTSVRKPQSSRSSLFWRALRVLALIAALALLLDWLFPLPLPDADSDAASVVLARDGRPLRAFPGRSGVWRQPARLDEVSPLYVDALLAYEDRWFWRHPGINPLSVLRAAGQALRYGRAVSGASTLTMQVARLIEPQRPGLGGKLRQSLRALQLEWHLDKREILELYLNRAPFGGAIEGVQSASWAYLGKPASSLSHAEAALLAVLPQAPSRLRPDRHSARAQAARDKVLQRLQAYALWSPQVVADARLENVVARRLQVPQQAALLAERLRREQPGAARIVSTLDADLQARLETLVASYVERLPARTSAALLLVDNASGEVRVYIGSARFGDAQRFGHLDMVQAWRSPGSTLKPFAYGLALDAGLIHSGSLLVDAPQHFDGYRPDNFDQRFRGPVSAQQALQQSLNVPAVALLQQLGPARFAARLEHAGLPLRLPSGARPNLSMILGGTEVRLEDLVGAYAALHRNGRSLRPRFLSAQREADDAEPNAAAARTEDDEPRLLSAGAAWIVAEMLRTAEREDRERFVGGGRDALAYKTGTSYGFRDSWALGGTAAVTLGVWVGRPDGTPLPGQFGAITALPLLLAVANSLPPELRASAPARPAAVTEHTVCWPLGGALADTPESLCHRRLQAWALADSLPRSFAPAGESQAPRVETVWLDPRSHQQRRADCRRGDEQAREIARWPALAAPWLSAAERLRSSPPPLAPGCQADAAFAAELQITGARDGSVLRSAGASLRAPQLQLRAAGASGEVSWLVNGLQQVRLPAAAAFEHEFAEAGPQDIVAIDSSGRFGRLQIEVAKRGRSG